MEDHELRHKLAELLVEALEVGSGKHERDVVDDLFAAFDVDFRLLEASVPRWRPMRKAELRDRATERLAGAAPSAAELLNTIARIGGRFVAMLEEVYELLSKHAATTTGSSETFRLERGDVDEAQLTISPAFLEQVRQLRVALLAVPVGAIDSEALGTLSRWDNGELYGTWPFSREEEGIRLLDAILHLNWIGPRILTLAAIDDEWALVGSALRGAHDAAEALVAVGESLVRSHMQHLAMLGDLEAGAAALTAYSDQMPRWQADTALAEVTHFRATGTLGQTAVEGYVQGIDEMSTVGLDRDLSPVVVPTEVFTPGSGVGSLAGFIAMWRLHLWATRERSALEGRLRDDPSAVERWLREITAACEECQAWLQRDVLRVSSSVDVAKQVELVEEFINLPLWRQRNLLYEIWVLVTTIDACEAADWRVALTGLHAADDVWVLSVGATKTPTATLRWRQDESVRLDVWREPARQTATGLLTPDVTVSTPVPHVRDLLVVEAKDRFGMSVGKRSAEHETTSSRRSALSVGERYAQGLHPIVTWVCNHCDFRGVASPETNLGDAWTRIHLADEFRPGQVPDAFARSVRTALRVPGERSAARADAPVARGLVLVIDVTASTARWLDAALAMVGRGGRPDGFASYRSILFSDHGGGEPFLVRKRGPFPTLADLIDDVRRQPRGSGGDFPEALEDAMQRCRELVADIGPQTIVLLSDAPPHSAAECPYDVDFDAEVQGLLDLGCELQIANDWGPTDPAWSDFGASEGVSIAPLAQLIATWDPAAGSAFRRSESRPD
jgi:hypothetical protein